MKCCVAPSGFQGAIASPRRNPPLCCRRTVLTYGCPSVRTFAKYPCTGSGSPSKSSFRKTRSDSGLAIARSSATSLAFALSRRAVVTRTASTKPTMTAPIAIRKTLSHKLPGKTSIDLQSIFHRIATSPANPSRAASAPEGTPWPHRRTPPHCQVCSSCTRDGRSVEMHRPAL